MKLKTFLCGDCKAIRAKENKNFLGGDTGLGTTAGEKAYAAMGAALQAGACLNASLSGWCEPGRHGDCEILRNK